FYREERLPLRRCQCHNRARGSRTSVPVRLNQPWTVGILSDTFELILHVSCTGFGSRRDNDQKPYGHSPLRYRFPQRINRTLCCRISFLWLHPATWQALCEGRI